MEHEEPPAARVRADARPLLAGHLGVQRWARGVWNHSGFRSLSACALPFPPVAALYGRSPPLSSPRARARGRACHGGGQRPCELRRRALCHGFGRADQVR